MVQSNMKRTTILRQHMKRLLVAIAAGLLAFLLLYQGSGYFIDRYLERSGYYASHDRQYVRSLQDYVDENQIASTDDDALTEWGKQQGDFFYQIYSDDKLLFQYYSRGSKSFQQAANLDFLEWVSPYDVRFTDGTYQVVVFGGYYYKTFKYMMAISVLGAFAVFLAVFLPAIRRRTSYITKLRDEIEILGSGDLDYEVTIRGNDELTDLAENLDQMRQALRHHMEEESRLTEERQTIVTKLSHDIRTPLTSMNLFADLLKRGDYETEEQRDHYIDRIQENAANLTNLAEELFQAAKDTGLAAAAIETPSGIDVGDPVFQTDGVVGTDLGAASVSQTAEGAGGGASEQELGRRVRLHAFVIDDFSAGVIASVNHKGDSDSTGAVTGNILGALLGYAAIEEKWKKDLEIADVILEMADDLCHGCLMSEDGSYRDEDWVMKYTRMHRAAR